MPHYKCARCRIRRYSATDPTDVVGERCPECGSLLEPVSSLSELVGFRSITSPESPEAGATGPRHELSAQADYDAEQWLDDGGSYHAAAVSLPRPPLTQ